MKNKANNTSKPSAKDKALKGRMIKTVNNLENIRKVKTYERLV